MIHVGFVINHALPLIIVIVIVGSGRRNRIVVGITIIVIIDNGTIVTGDASNFYKVVFY